jgi:hypothetical protein
MNLSKRRLQQIIKEESNAVMTDIEEGFISYIKGKYQDAIRAGALDEQNQDPYAAAEEQAEEDPDMDAEEQADFEARMAELSSPTGELSGEISAAEELSSEEINAALAASAGRPVQRPGGEEEGVQAVSRGRSDFQAFHDELAASYANPDLEQALDADYLDWRELHGVPGPELDPYSEEAITRRLANLGQRESLTRSKLRRMVMEELSASDAQALALGHTRLYPARGAQGTGFDPLLDVVVDPDTGNLIPGRLSAADPDVLITPGGPDEFGNRGVKFSYEGDFGMEDDVPEPEEEPDDSWGPTDAPYEWRPPRDPGGGPIPLPIFDPGAAEEEEPPWRALEEGPEATRINETLTRWQKIIKS